MGAVLVAVFSVGNVYAAGQGNFKERLPDVAWRTYAQNYKDLVLASCIAQAYSAEPQAAADAGATAAGLDSTWTRYDPEKGSGEIDKLVGQFLARDYPSIHGPKIRLDLMKCFDLYHSKELQTMVKRLVIQPKRSYVQDNRITKNKQSKNHEKRRPSVNKKTTQEVEYFKF
ncbi:MAG: type VI secretion system amidase immunity protein Tai4 [Burkholderiaceae bacterium]|nr:type VI secretion system amidase immunity protein Tai4 [Burkholderiaceae bacterium]